MTLENLMQRLADLNHWQIDLLTAGILIQSAIFSVVPEEAVLLTLGALIFQGKLSPVEAFLSYQLGLIPADLILLGLGRVASKGMNRSAFFSKLISHPTTLLATSLIRRHAKTLIFLTRFTPTVRSPIYIAAGVSRVSLRLFVLTDWAASFLHIPLLLALGFFVARRASSPTEMLQSLLVVFGFIFAGGLALSIGVKRRAARTIPTPP